MASLADKVIITCAVTGAIHTPTMSDALPLTPNEIAEQAIAAAEAGAAILHLHARDPKDGRPTPDPAVFMQFLPRIKQNCDAVINITTGGSLKMTRGRAPGGAAQGLARNGLAQHGLDEFRPLSGRRQIQVLGSTTGKNPICAESDDYIFRNTFRDIEKIYRTPGRGARHQVRA